MVGIVFHIFPNPRGGREGLNEAEYIAQEDIIALLARFEINKKTAKELIHKNGEVLIRENVQYVYDKKRNMDVNNLAGYITRAIEDNYTDSKA